MVYYFTKKFNNQLDNVLIIQIDNVLITKWFALGLQPVSAKKNAVYTVLCSILINV